MGIDEEIENVIDYLYGIWRDVDLFLQKYEDRDDEEYRKVSFNLLKRIKYQLEKAQEMLECIGEKDEER